MAKRYSVAAHKRASKVKKEVARAQPGYNVGGTRAKPKAAKPKKTRVSVRPKSPVAVALYQASQVPKKMDKAIRTYQAAEKRAIRKAGQGVSASINTQRKKILAAGKKAREGFVKATGLKIR